MLRLRKNTLKTVKELDAFPKVPESYQETSPTRGGLSILIFGLILVLVTSEVIYYTNTELKYEYEVDKIFDGKLKINVDITVAMKCQQIGADVLDLTGQTVDSFGELTEEEVHFELSPNQKRYQEMVHHMNDYLRNEYHALHDVLWKTAFRQLAYQKPAREDRPDYEPDGCRLTGTLEVNKVAGNFHITAGKSIPVFPRGHAHLALMVSDKDYNFSHRIDHFSFGDQTDGMINPLDGDEKITKNNYHLFQYFMQIVPTKVNTRHNQLDTFQFAVTERNRSINHAKGSHGVPGIFVKYDLSSFKVAVSEEHKPFWQFLVRLCGIIGGIFATSGMLHGLIGFLFDVVCCRLKIGKYKPLEANDTTVPTSSLSSDLHSETIPGVSLVAPDMNNIPKITDPPH